MRRIGLAAIILLLSGCTSTAPRKSDDTFLAAMFAGESPLGEQKVAEIVAAAAKYPLGSKENPVRAEMPEGQRAYLASLRCADGKPPQILQRYNIGPGIYASIVDAYPLDCGAAAPGKLVVYMDMYHRGYVETHPVPGFTMATRDTAL